ncbi:MAG: thioredoxin family protein [Nitriliruptorales bacterium]
MRVTLMYFESCRSWTLTYERLSALASELGFELERRKVRTAEEAEQAGFRGSPTILVDGRDPFADGEEQVGGLACRVYQTLKGPAGTPSQQQLRDVLTARLNESTFADH